MTCGTRNAGHSSVTYAIVMMKIPGVTTPCSNRHTASSGKLVDVAVSKVQTASAAIEPTMVFLRSTLSAKVASMPADKATPSVDALIVQLTWASDAWKTRDSRGSKGWVQ